MRLNLFVATLLTLFLVPWAWGAQVQAYDPTPPDLSQRVATQDAFRILEDYMQGLILENVGLKADIQDYSRPELTEDNLVPSLGHDLKAETGYLANVIEGQGQDLPLEGDLNPTSHTLEEEEAASRNATLERQQLETEGQDLPLESDKAASKNHKLVRKQEKKICHAQTKIKGLKTETKDLQQIVKNKKLQVKNLKSTGKMNKEYNRALKNILSDQNEKIRLIQQRIKLVQIRRRSAERVVKRIKRSNDKLKRTVKPSN